MINKNLFKFQCLKLIIFDDIEEILNREFLDLIKEILSTINFQQFVFYSEIENKNNIEEIFGKYINNLKIITTKEEALSFDNVRQFYIETKKEWKSEILLNLYKTMEINQSLIYCNNKKTAENILHILNDKNFPANYIDEEYSASEKEKILDDFKKGNLRILIFTTFNFRLNDFSQISLIINYDFPENKETYLKRIGKLEFIKHKTNAINLITIEDKERIKEVQSYYNIVLQELPIELSAIK
jgi:ATP-dependent RNA helicase